MNTSPFGNVSREPEVHGVSHDESAITSSASVARYFWPGRIISRFITCLDRHGTAMWLPTQEGFRRLPACDYSKCRSPNFECSEPHLSSARCSFARQKSLKWRKRTHLFTLPNPASIISPLAGATGFDRNLNDRRDACRAPLCSSLKRVGKNNCQ